MAFLTIGPLVLAVWVSVRNVVMQAAADRDYGELGDDEEFESAVARTEGFAWLLKALYSAAVRSRIGSAIVAIFSAAIGVVSTLKIGIPFLRGDDTNLWGFVTGWATWVGLAEAVLFLLVPLLCIPMLITALVKRDRELILGSVAVLAFVAVGAYSLVVMGSFDPLLQLFR